MFSTIKLWIYGIGAAAIAVAIGMFQYRGSKIEELEADVEAAENKAKVVEKAIEAKEHVLDFETTNKVAAAKAEGRNYDDIKEHFYNI